MTSTEAVGPGRSRHHAGRRRHRTRCRRIAARAPAIGAIRRLSRWKRISCRTCLKPCRWPAHTRAESSVRSRMTHSIGDCTEMTASKLLTHGGVDKANVLWFLPDPWRRTLSWHDAWARATSRSNISPRWPRLPMIAAIMACCCQQAAPARIAGSSPRRLVPLTERLRYLVAVRPGLQSPAVAARMTATLDRISNGRLLINVVTGGDPVENAGRRHLPQPTTTAMP